MDDKSELTEILFKVRDRESEGDEEREREAGEEKERRRDGERDQPFHNPIKIQIQHLRYISTVNILPPSPHILKGLDFYSTQVENSEIYFPHQKQ